MEVKKPIKFEFTAENKRGIMVLPKHCTPYVLFTNDDSKHRRLRDQLLKRIFTVAEIIARW